MLTNVGCFIVPFLAQHIYIHTYTHIRVVCLAPDSKSRFKVRDGCSEQRIGVRYCHGCRLVPFCHGRQLRKAVPASVNSTLIIMTGRGKKRSTNVRSCHHLLVLMFGCLGGLNRVFWLAAEVTDALPPPDLKKKKGGLPHHFA